MMPSTARKFLMFFSAGLVLIGLSKLYAGFYEHVQNDGGKRIPASATSVRDLGRHWVTFDLEDEGRTRRFLFKPKAPGSWENDIILELK
jgi:hypothetical protein